ncbi:MAG TPA: molybdenum cofactor guanylyltransferase [Bacteroidales bacterium]|nr:molybdenum cofactor guanylyltransferase [Bacteroidales bacterium]HPT11946.1 molybdenum cofactor guanylyltransferase [Bacteroidales bacterium]
MPLFNDIAAVILTGGKGSRMGSVNKSLIEIQGETIISRTLHVVRPLFGEIIISGKEITGLPYTDIIFTADRFAGRGPLAGIESALNVTKSEYIFVFAGDMPWLSPELISDQIRFMLANPCDILVPRLSDEIEPLHAIISKNVSQLLTQYLESEKRNAVRYFYSGTNMKYFDIKSPRYRENPFANINRPEDLEL